MRLVDQTYLCHGFFKIKDRRSLLLRHYCHHSYRGSGSERTCMYSSVDEVIAEILKKGLTMQASQDSKLFILYKLYQQ